MIEVLILPMLPFLFLPPLALAPAGLFAWLHARCKARSGRRSVMILLAIVTWLLYSAYETFMYYWSQSVVAPIRVDLLLVSPVLYAATLLGLFAYFRCRNSAEA
ncbi:MAG: hypothetical protein ACTSW2_02035 [Alphaproteobacteria bacterium]